MFCVPKTLISSSENDVEVSTTSSDPELALVIMDGGSIVSIRGKGGVTPLQFFGSEKKKGEGDPVP